MSQYSGPLVLVGNRSAKTLTISQSLATKIAAQDHIRAGMLSSIVPSTIAGQTLLLAALGIAALALVGVWHRRLVVQNRRLSNAIDNMTQGLCMFDAQGSIVLTNRRYIGMYNLSPEIVRPGCSLQEPVSYTHLTLPT